MGDAFTSVSEDLLPETSKESTDSSPTSDISDANSNGETIEVCRLLSVIIRFLSIKSNAVRVYLNSYCVALSILFSQIFTICIVLHKN